MAKRYGVMDMQLTTKYQYVVKKLLLTKQQEVIGHELLTTEYSLRLMST
jgi:hypothetical protein